MRAALSPETERMAAAWLAVDVDAASRATLQRLVAAGDEAGLQDALGSRLEFGEALEVVLPTARAAARQPPQRRRCLAPLPATAPLPAPRPPQAPPACGGAWDRVPTA